MRRLDVLLEGGSFFESPMRDRRILRRTPDVVLCLGRRKAAGRPVRSPGLVYDGVTTGAGPRA